jgi:hypothetical protein
VTSDGGLILVRGLDKRLGLSELMDHLSSAETQRRSCSAGQKAVLVVKSVQYGVCHNSARSVETMPLALELHGEIQGRIGKAGSQGRVWPASIVMRQPTPKSFSKMLLGQEDDPIQTPAPKCPG